MANEHFLKPQEHPELKIVQCRKSCNSFTLKLLTENSDLEKLQSDLKIGFRDNKF